MALVTYDLVDAVGLVTLNRPDSHNALDVDAASELAAVLMEASSDPGVRCLAITGAGKSFCVGGDLKWVDGHAGGRPAAFHELAAHVNMAITEICRMPKPVIAAVNGVAAGGGFSLALACDFRVMADVAVLRQGYTSNGLCIDAAGTFTLPKLVGLSRALEIAAFDDAIDAKRALEWGLATRVVPFDELHAETMLFAKHLVDRSVNAFALVKELIFQSYNATLESQLESERKGIVLSATNAEGKEGIDAFLQKRRPNYRI